MDRDDWQIVCGVILVAGGAGWWLHPGAGMVIAGVCLVVPFFLSAKNRGG